jgi:hypothetical protein
VREGYQPRWPEGPAAARGADCPHRIPAIPSSVAVCRKTQRNKLVGGALRSRHDVSFEARVRARRSARMRHGADAQLLHRCARLRSDRPGARSRAATASRKSCSPRTLLLTITRLLFAMFGDAPSSSNRVDHPALRSSGSLPELASFTWARILKLSLRRLAANNCWCRRPGKRGRLL